MKRQIEDLFFKYNTTPRQGGANNIQFDLPDVYQPIPGDIIEMIISERGSNGFVSYYAKLVCFRYPDSDENFTGLDITSIDGNLRDDNKGYSRLFSASYILNGQKKSISLYGPDDAVVTIEKTVTNTVNMIVHRSTAPIDLYYL